MRRWAALTMSSVVLGGLAGCAGPQMIRSGVPGDVPLPSTAAPSATSAPSPARVPGTNCPAPSQWQGSPAPTTVNGTPGNTEQAQELTQAIGSLEFGPYADVYGTLIDDYPPGRVALCVTDPARGRQMAQAAKRAHPEIDLSLLDIYRCRYTEHTLQTAFRKLMDDTGPEIAGYPVYSIGPLPDASGIQIETSRAGSTSQALRDVVAGELGSIPFSVVAGTAAAG